MILLQKSGKPYRCPAAFLADLDDRHRADVTTRAEVLAFLKKHPDEHFLLGSGSEPTQEAAPGEAAEVVFCGLVKWDSKRGLLYNKPLS